MFAYIKGRVTETGIDTVVIENNGIGYRIYTSASTLAAIDRDDPSTFLHTKLNIKDDHFELCGFKTHMELELYENLVSVSGIGTKGAIGILSALSVESLIAAIIQEDEVRLVKVPGIGKKTAQRVILELRDKFKKQYRLASEEDGGVLEADWSSSKTDKGQEVIQALTALGYTAKEAKSAVAQLEIEELNLEEAIKQAFKLLAK